MFGGKNNLMKLLLTIFLIFTSFIVNAQYHFYISNWYLVPDTISEEWVFDDVYYNEYPYHPQYIRIRDNPLVNTVHLFFDIENLTLTTSYIQYDGYEYDVSVEYFEEWGVWGHDDDGTFMVEMLSGENYLYIDDYIEGMTEFTGLLCKPQFIKNDTDYNIEYMVKEEDKLYFGKKSLRVVGFD